MILVNDILFPSKYGKWRIEECKAFIDQYQADFIVHKIESYAGIKYKVDYEEMAEYFDLSEYNIVIFDEKYNYLNKYNHRIDGTKFNCKSIFSYAFIRGTSFDVKNYSAVYHIFLSSYKRFNDSFEYPQHKQFIHLYPGGGLSNKNDISKIHKSVKLISTNYVTSEWLRAQKYDFVEAFGGTLLPKNHQHIRKNKNNGALNICFSNLGVNSQKGAQYYKILAENYKKQFPKDEVTFRSIGNCESSVHIMNIPPMAMEDLDNLYQNDIDVVVNLEDGSAYNGWPLGVEAILNGVVPITTDIHGSKKHSKFTDAMMFIVEKNDVKSMMKAVRRLYLDRNLLLKMSNNIQDHANDVFSYEKQQQKIFDFINDNSAEKRNMKIYETIAPPYFTNNTIFNIRNHVHPIITETNVVIKNSDINSHIFNKIENGEPLSIARYNDGEWICMLRIPDKKLYDIHRVKWDDNTEKFVDQYLTPIIASAPYLIGVSTEVLKKDYIVKHIYEYIKNLNLIDGGLFCRWQIDGTILKLLDAIKTRNVIIVGPDYLQQLSTYLNFKHIVTDNNIKVINNSIKDNCVVTYQHEDIKTQLDAVINDKCIVLYSCSVVAKKLINDYHKMDIIQLDMGAAFDNLCGLKTRPWHD